MDTCIFCKIVKKEIPCYKVYEDNDFLAFLDIRPLNKGHTLVIPKKHFRWVYDVDNIDIYYVVVKKVANAIKRAFNTDYVISLVFGEEVHHAHVWLVPRFKDDGHGSSIDLKNRKNFTEHEMQEFGEEISKSI